MQTGFILNAEGFQSCVDRFQSECREVSVLCRQVSVWMQWGFSRQRVVVQLTDREFTQWFWRQQLAEQRLAEGNPSWPILGLKHTHTLSPCTLLNKDMQRGTHLGQYWVWNTHTHTHYHLVHYWTKAEGNPSWPILGLKHTRTHYHLVHYWTKTGRWELILANTGMKCTRTLSPCTLITNLDITCITLSKWRTLPPPSAPSHTHNNSVHW